MAKEHKEIKKITAGSIFSWVFGVLFIIAGVGVISQGSYIPGILIMLCSAMILPYFNKISAEKFHFQISGGIKFILIIIIFVLIGISASNSGISNLDIDSNSQPSTKNVGENANTNKPLSEITTYTFGDKFIVGNFAYTFNDYQTKSYLGSEYFGEEADGVFLIFDVTIENVAKESKTLWGSYVTVLDDQERRFEHDSMAEIYLDDSFSFEQMQPGLPKNGKIVFDVPQNINGFIEVSSDSVWSDEVKYLSWKVE